MDAESDPGSVTVSIGGLWVMIEADLALDDCEMSAADTLAWLMCGVSCQDDAGWGEG